MGSITPQSELEIESTTGTVYIAEKTTDGEEGYFNHADGTTNVVMKSIPIHVENIRRLNQQPTINREGYQLINFHSSLTEEPFLNANLPENKSLIQGVYFDECRKLAEEATGAALAQPYVFRVRNQERTMADLDKADFLKDSVPIAHVDRDPVTALERLRASLGEEKADALLRKYKHYASMNVWRPVKNPAQKWPLMLADHHAIPDWDYETHMFRLLSNNDKHRVSDRGAKNHETLLKYDEGYRYVYAPNMSPDEAWLFYAFHSDPALAVPHSAFWDDSTSPDAPTRWSIEVRVWVFFEEL
ncbi:hypothetical protein VMCG_01541 [Cytospora schulzeri]|uniref:Uncharacterized protein n=1 Tax=Cytospora schulzeri TaxID=448051 RepID=A0A423X5C5_9PEZI|nr:hypothetical protein VMCG_01541 [Valsa malicola]